MPLSTKTKTMLWGRAAAKCSLPSCRQDLVIDALDTDDPSLVGEAAHIIAEQPGGPRGDANFPLERRNAYANLVLLCALHHKQVDDHVNDFSVARLQQIKTEHEQWVRTNLSGFDPAKQADDETWAGYIEQWESKADLDNWLANNSALMQPISGMPFKYFQKLSELPIWILSRVWPTTHPDLQAALENFRFVVSDLLNLFHKYCRPIDITDPTSDLRTERFYRIKDHDVETYQLLFNRYEFHVELLEDLTCEMTRAANYVCDLVRSSLDRSFRIDAVCF